MAIGIHKLALPEELTDIIFHFACLQSEQCDRRAHLHSFSSKRALTPRPLDLPTLFALSLVSRRANAVATPLLYRSPALQSTDALAEFARALSGRPALGTHVRHLWVGHVDAGEPLPLSMFGLGPQHDPESTIDEWVQQLYEVAETTGGSEQQDDMNGSFSLPDATAEPLDWADATSYPVVRRTPASSAAQDGSSRLKRWSTHFAHPTLFARSGASHLILPAERPEDVSSEEEWGAWDSLGGGRTFSNAPTLGSVLAQVRAVLALMPRLELLALNGFLEKVVASMAVPPGLPKLRCLSLGPPPSYWSSPLVFGGSSHPAFSSIERLHIAGCMLFPSEARALAGADGALPRLRELCWTMWAAHTNDHPLDVCTTIETLLGGPKLEGVQKQSPNAERRGVELLHCTLHPFDFAHFATSAPRALREDPRLVVRRCESEELDEGLDLMAQAWIREARSLDGLPLADAHGTHVPDDEMGDST